MEFYLSHKFSLTLYLNYFCITLFLLIKNIISVIKFIFWNLNKKIFRINEIGKIVNTQKRKTMLILLPSPFVMRMPPSLSNCSSPSSSPSKKLGKANLLYKKYIFDKKSGVQKTRKFKQIWGQECRFYCWILRISGYSFWGLVFSIFGCVMRWFKSNSRRTKRKTAWIGVLWGPAFLSIHPAFHGLGVGWVLQQYYRAGWVEVGAAGAFAFGPTELALAAVSPGFCACLSLVDACCCPSCPAPPVAHSAVDCLSMKSVSGVFCRIFGSGTFLPCSIWAMIMFMSSVSIRFQSSSRSFSRFFSLIFK